MKKVIIGGAALYCGDMRKVLTSFASESIDFIFTDPPYGHNNNSDDLISKWELALGVTYNKYDLPNEERPIMSDDRTSADNLAIFLFTEAKRLLPKGGCCCCCCCSGGGPDPQFARWSLWMEELLGFKQQVVWDKGPMGMGWHYRRSYETVLVGEKPGSACRWYDKTSKVENIIRPSKQISKIIPSAKEHPTTKPPGLAAHFIRLHAKVGHVVLDPFMGGGSTLIAALKLGRKFIGVELDENWFDRCVILAKEMNRQDRFLGRSA